MSIREEHLDTIYTKCRGPIFQNKNIVIRIHRRIYYIIYSIDKGSRYKASAYIYV